MLNKLVWWRYFSRGRGEPWTRGEADCSPSPSTREAARARTSSFLSKWEKSSCFPSWFPDGLSQLIGRPDLISSPDGSRYLTGHFPECMGKVETRTGIGLSLWLAADLTAGREACRLQVLGKQCATVEKIGYLVLKLFSATYKLFELHLSHLSALSLCLLFWEKKRKDSSSIGLLSLLWALNDFLYVECSHTQ